MARGELVWYNGKILPVEQAKISLFTHGLHYGTGAFEGIRAYKQKRGGGAVFRLGEHMQRFEESFKIMDLKLSFSQEQLERAVVETCKANKFEECYIRPIGYIGENALGVYPGPHPSVDVAILCWEWGKYLGKDGADSGARVRVSSFIRPHVNSIMTKGKLTANYITGVMAKREAIGLGFDESLMLDPEGYLTEGTGMNLFMVKNGVVKTTPLTSILGGITRNTIIDFMAGEKIPHVETRFTRDELWCADEVFLTGTAAEVTPVKEIDGRVIGRGASAGKVGPITKKIQTEYAMIVTGDHPKYGKGWLTTIE